MQSSVPSSNKSHTLSMKDRSALMLDGVEDVLDFDENVITVRTALGALVIEGSSLHITAFSAENGTLAVTGTLVCLTYEDKREKTAKTWKGLFRT